jgi:hypothetical protein
MCNVSLPPLRRQHEKHSANFVSIRPSAFVISETLFFSANNWRRNYEQTHEMLPNQHSIIQRILFTLNCNLQVITHHSFILRTLFSNFYQGSVGSVLLSSFQLKNSPFCLIKRK